MKGRTHLKAILGIFLVILCNNYTPIFATFTSTLYLGIYSGEESGQLREFHRDIYQGGCYEYDTADPSTVYCRFYGDCCVDPMRVRERLEPGSFSCQRAPGSKSGKFWSLVCRAFCTCVEKCSLCAKTPYYGSW